MSNNQIKLAVIWVVIWSIGTYLTTFIPDLTARILVSMGFGFLCGLIGSQQVLNSD